MTNPFSSMGMMQENEKYEAAKESFAAAGYKTVRQKMEILNWQPEDLIWFFKYSLKHDDLAKEGYEDYVKHQTAKGREPSVEFQKVKLHLTAVKDFINENKQPWGAPKYILEKTMAPLHVPKYQRVTKKKIQEKESDMNLNSVFAGKVLEAYAEHTDSTTQEVIHDLVIENLEMTDLFKQMMINFKNQITLELIKEAFKKGQLTFNPKKEVVTVYRPPLSTNHNLHDRFKKTEVNDDELPF